MNIITSHEQLKEMVEYYLGQDALAFDVETVGDRRGDTPVNEVLWISFATHGRCDVIPMGHPNGELLDVIYPLTGQGEKRVQAGLQARPSDYSRDAKKSTKVFSDPPKQLFPSEVFAALKPLLFDNSKLTKPDSIRYLKQVFSGQESQENFSINGQVKDYTKISEIFSVFDKNILDEFEKEFLNFSISVSVEFISFDKVPLPRPN